jgi:ribonuclease Z
MRNVFKLLLLFLSFLVSISAHAEETRVVILGTGTPVPDYRRAGAGVAVIHKGQAYLFDAGNGIVQRAIEANHSYPLFVFHSPAQ